MLSKTPKSTERLMKIAIKENEATGVLHTECVSCKNYYTVYEVAKKNPHYEQQIPRSDNR